MQRFSYHFYGGKKITFLEFIERFVYFYFYLLLLIIIVFLSSFPYKKLSFAPTSFLTFLASFHIYALISGFLSFSNYIRFQCGSARPREQICHGPPHQSCFAQVSLKSLNRFECKRWRTWALLLPFLTAFLWLTP